VSYSSLTIHAFARAPHLMVGPKSIGSAPKSSDRIPRLFPSRDSGQSENSLARPRMSVPKTRDSQIFPRELRPISGRLPGGFRTTCREIDGVLLITSPAKISSGSGNIKRSSYRPQHRGIRPSSTCNQESPGGRPLISLANRFTRLTWNAALSCLVHLITTNKCATRYAA
jgi:hypothetical protein